MADSIDTVAVESATTAVAAANVAQDAAVHAEAVVTEAETVATEVNTETVVTAAEAAVVLAETQAAIATQEAAQVIQAGVAAIAENEVKESWQDEAIRSLQAGQISLSEAMGIMATDLQGIKAAIVELVSPPSIQAQATGAESIPTVSTTEAITETSSSTGTAASPKDADGNPVVEPVNADKRRRVLRFL